MNKLKIDSPFWNKTFFVLLSWFFNFTIIAQDCDPFVLMTIPKSGSHLAIKALHYMTGSSPVWHTRFPAVYCIPPKEGFLYTHLCLNKQLEQDYNRFPQLKKILNIRDLRDVCISMVGHILQMPWPGMSSNQREAFKRASFDEQLMFVIEYDYEIDSKNPNTIQVSMRKLAEQALDFYQSGDYLICRYENLVGPKGGGSQIAQLNELKNIANYLSIKLSDKDLSIIGPQLYGNEVDPFQKKGFEHYKSTFREGRVGGWKELFKESHKLAFKKKLNHALIALGYAVDDNW